MKISEAESKVLEVFWRAAGPLSAEEVVAAMDNDRDWSAGTIRTFLTRLVKKKALAAKPDGRRYLYRPLVKRDDFVHKQSRDLIDRLFGGRITPFIAQFSSRLKRLIERLDHER